MTPPANTLPGARRPSWAVVYTTGVPFLHKALPLLGVAETDLEDVMQDVLLAAYRGLGRYDGARYARVPEDLALPEDEGAGGVATLAGLRPRLSRDPLCAWLFGIAWRQVSHYLDRAHRRREILVGLLHTSPVFTRVEQRPGPEQRAMTAESIELMSGLLSCMDLQRRGILVLHDVLEIKISAIARELGINRNTVQNRLRLAREDFRAAVKRLGDERRRALRAEGDAPPWVKPRARPTPAPPRGRRRR